MSESIYGRPTNEQLLQDANMWTKRAEEHERMAEFCRGQASRFLGRIASDDLGARPKLVLVKGGQDG